MYASKNEKRLLQIGTAFSEIYEDVSTTKFWQLLWLNYAFYRFLLP